MRTFPVISTKYEHVNNFINTLAPVVCNAWIKYRREEKKTISPAVILAQAAKESGWNLGAASLFGIKGSDAEYDTTEYIDGEYVNIKDSFEKYPDVMGAVYGYLDLMQWNNYDDATAANTVEGELYGLTNAVNNTDRDAEGNWVGYNYATAPDYYETTLAIINDFDLRAFNDYVWSVVNEKDDTEEIEQPSEKLNESVIEQFTVVSTVMEKNADRSSKLQVTTMQIIRPPWKLSIILKRKARMSRQRKHHRRQKKERQ